MERIKIRLFLCDDASVEIETTITPKQFDQILSAINSNKYSGYYLNVNDILESPEKVKAIVLGSKFLQSIYLADDIDDYNLEELGYREIFAANE